MRPLMTDAITTSHYAGGQIHGISADLAHLERITPGSADQVLLGKDMVADRPGGRVITAAIAGRLVGFMLCLPGDADAELQA